MPCCTIFISHSTDFTLECAKNPPYEVLEALVAALKAAGRYEVLLDRDTDRAGDDWQRRIDGWIEGCDAAVVLLSERALQSDYVAYETTLLARRSQHDRGFLLIPVFIPPVDSARLRLSRLWPQRLDAKQFAAGDADSVVEKVLGNLKAVACPEPPVRRRAGALSALLSDVPAPVIREAAAVFDDELARVLPADIDALRLRFAIELTATGMAPPTVLAIQHCRTHFKSAVQSTLQEIVRLIAASWVDVRAAEQIVRVVRQEQSLHALGLHTGDFVIADIHLVSARYCDKTDAWHVATCNGLVDERPAVTLIGEVRRALAHELNDIPETEVGEELEALRWSGQPVLVILPHAGVGPEELAALRKEFPTVTFLLLTAWPATGGLRLGPVHIECLPYLPAAESAFHAQYNPFRRSLTISA